MENAAEATEVIKLAHFIRFHQLSDAVSVAVASNFYVGPDEKALEEFTKKNGLENLTCDQICEIIKLYEEPFKLIEFKAKEELLKIGEHEYIAES